jgi:hypothetical protein
MLKMKMIFARSLELGSKWGVAALEKIRHSL